MKQEQLRKKERKVKLIGTEEEVLAIEAIFDDAADDNQCEIVSKSNLLPNRGQDTVRKFIQIKGIEEE